MPQGLLALPAALGCALALSASFYLSQRRRGPAWRFAAALGAGVAWWCAGQVAWFLADEHATRLVLAQWQYVGIAFTPPLWLVTALAWTGRRAWTRPRALAGLFAIPALTVLAAFTNDAHGLIWREFLPVPGRAAAEAHYGPWFLVHTAYSYIVAAAGTLLIAARLAASPHYRVQFGVVVLGPVIVVSMNAMHLVYKTRLPIDPTPASFALAYGALAWAMRRHHMFELLPLARGLAIESLRDGVLVVDTDERVVDLNPAASALMEIGSPPLGARLETALPEWPQLGSSEGDRRTGEVVRGSRRIEVRVSPIIDSGGVAAGRVVVLRDVTAERLAQAALLETQARLQSANDELARLARTDALTGLANRRSFDEKLREEWARSRRHDRPLSMIAMDVDHFKRVNDAHGHPVGDRVLAAIGRALARSIRPGDLAARIGGEEFATLLPETALGDARDVALRLRSALADISHVDASSSPFRTTMSFGVTSVLSPPESTDSPEALLGRADRALYAAKADGRDSVFLCLGSSFERAG